MSAFDRPTLERALRLGHSPQALRSAALHNVRLHIGAAEVYGRDDWIGLEARRGAAWGERPVEVASQIDAPIGQAGHMIAARWRLGSGPAAPAMATFSLVREGKIVREWQYYDRSVLPRVAPGLQEPMRRVGIAAEYGENRAVAGQLNVSPSAAAVAPGTLVADAVVQHWHRLWNLERRWPIAALPLLEDPVMYCERLLSSGQRAALQWRLVGRRRSHGTAASVRTMIHGLSFFERQAAVVTHVADHFDPSPDD